MRLLKMSWRSWCKTKAGFFFLLLLRQTKNIVVVMICLNLDLNKRKTFAKAETCLETELKPIGKPF